MKNQLKLTYLSSIESLSFRGKLITILNHEVDLYNGILFLEYFSVTHSYHLLTNNL